MLRLKGPVAYYIRKSDKKSDLERQRGLLTTFCADHRIAVADHLRFEDTGSRDLSHKRPNFQRMLQAIKNGEIGTVLIVSFERFGIEDSDEFFKYRSIFLDHGTTLFSTEADEGDLTAKDQMTMLKIVFKAEGSRDEQRKKGSRSITGKFTRITQTKSYQGGPIPYGYEKQCRNPAGELLWTLRYEGPGRRLQVMPNGTTTRFDGDKDTHPQKARYDTIRLVPSTDEERLENVRLMFDLWVNRDITILGICKHLNSLGRTHYGEPWSPTSVRGILDNPVYTGAMVFNRKKSGRFAECVQGRDRFHEREDKFRVYQRDESEWTVIPDVHPHLIDKEVFEEAQKKLEAIGWSNKHETHEGHRPPRRPEFWLRPFARCGHCKGRMFAKTVNDISYLICGAHKRNKSKGVESKCGFYSVRCDVVEKIVLERFGKLEAKASSLGRVGLVTLLEKQNLLLRNVLAMAHAVEPLLEKIAKKYKLKDEHSAPVAHRAKAIETQVALKVEAGEIERGEYQEFEKKLLAEQDAKIDAEIARLRSRLEVITEKWLDANEEQARILKRKADDIDEEIKKLDGSRFTKLARQNREIDVEVGRLLEAIRTVQGDDQLARGQALRKLMDEMYLYFEKKETVKAKSKLLKVDFGACGTSEVCATACRGPRTGRPAPGGS